MKSFSIEVDPFVDIEVDNDVPKIVCGAFVGDSDTPFETDFTFEEVINNFISYNCVPSEPPTMRVEDKLLVLSQLDKFVELIQFKMTEVKLIKEVK